MGTAGVRPQANAGDPDATGDPSVLLAHAQARLAQSLPPPPTGETGVLVEAARTALLSPGKRARPVMAMLACAHVGGAPLSALDYGCAVEMVHAASLVLDDLPCMDDAALRRGAPTVHRAHGEDAAVLSAIALLNQAHRTVLGDAGLGAEHRLALLEALTEAVGFDGLAQGQIRDLRDGADDRTEYGLRRLNHLKTGALFVAAVRGGGLIGGGVPAQLDALATFGEAVGFAFQLCDDLHDVDATPETLGKDVRQDLGKVTFVDLWGAGRVRMAIRQSLVRAQDALGPDCALGAYAWELFRNAGFTR